MWIENWYNSNCNGQWEHDYGIIIETIDNPGWAVKIELHGTQIADISIPWTYFENSPNDWYGFKFENEVFFASGDPFKLDKLLNVFREYVSANSEGNLV